MSLQSRFEQLEEDISIQRERNKDCFLQSEVEKPYPVDKLYDLTPITFDSFQEGTSWSGERNPKDIPKDLYFALGLAGEVGECVEHIKKKYRDNDGVMSEKRKEKIIGEAGDVLFYLSCLMETCGIKMSDVAKFNQKKTLIRLKEWRGNNE